MNWSLLSTCELIDGQNAEQAPPADAPQGRATLQGWATCVPRHYHCRWVHVEVLVVMQHLQEYSGWSHFTCNLRLVH